MSASSKPSSSTAAINAMLSEGALARACDDLDAQAADIGDEQHGEPL